MIIKLQDKKRIDLCEICLLTSPPYQVFDEFYTLGKRKFGIDYVNKFKEPIYVRKVLRELIKYNAFDTNRKSINVITSFDYVKYEKIKELLLKHIQFVGSRFGFKDGIIVVINANSNKLRCFSSTIVDSDEYIYESFDKKQVGSSLKPFLLYPALKSKYINLTDFTNDSMVNLKGFVPRNWDHKFMGKITIEEALKKSRNIPFVKILNQVGVDNFVKVLSKLGYLDYSGTHKYDLSLILGKISTNIITHTNAYSIFLNSEIKEVGYVDEINGIPVSDSRKINRFDDSILSEIGTILRDHNSKYLYGKTGTTDDHRDNYYVGFNQGQNAFGIWVGNKNLKPMSKLAFASVTTKSLSVRLEDYLV